MSKEVAFKAVELGMQNTNASGLLFYGGEPLLERQLIYDTVDYAESIKNTNIKQNPNQNEKQNNKQNTNHTFIYKMTTNGTLLDEEFLIFANKVNLTIGFSHDGQAQDKCRLTNDGSGTFDMLNDKIALLLKYQPYAIGLSVIDSTTVQNTTETVKFLFDKGFKYITLNLNYGKEANWTRDHLKILEEEYKKLAELYIQRTSAEEKFYLGPIDIKIVSLLKGEDNIIDRRQMALNQPSVAPDGMIYPGSRYLNNPIFEIGNVFTGINKEKQKSIFEKGSIPPEPCQKCAIRTRCNYAYDTLISQDNEIIPDISPVQCAHEQLLTPIADSVAEQLYTEQNALFIHKHYNDLYPILSLVEDRAK